MNLSYCFTNRVPGVLIFAFLVLSGCSATTTKSADNGSDIAEPPVAAVQVAGQSEVLPPVDPKVMEHVFAAEALGSNGDYAGAATEYLAAALISDDPDVAERAAKVAAAAGEWQKVVLASDRWSVLDPNSIDALQLAAGSRLHEGDYTGAEYQLGKFLELTSSDPAMGWKQVAKMLSTARDGFKANRVINHLIADANAQDNADALFARSQLAARNGELEVAAESVQQAIDIDPTRSDLLAWSGTLAVNLNDTELALERYRQAWKLDPADPGIAMAYAEMLKRNGDLDSALKVLEELPDTPEMRFGRVAFALNAEDTVTATSLYRGFDTVVYSDPSEAAFQAAQSAELLELPREAIDWYAKVGGERVVRATMRQAFLSAGLGEVDEAQALLLGLRAQGNMKIVAQSFLAESEILRGADRPEDAMQVLNSALATYPDNDTLRYDRALLAVELAQLELAESDLRKIIAMQPENAAALNALGYTLVDLTDRYEEAQQYILMAYELQPLEPSIIDSMGWLAYRLNNLEDAERYLQLAWVSAQGAEIAAHLGEVLWVSGKKDQAREIWRQGLEIESDNKVLLETMQRLGESP
jgi:tetratricopeptide (TPR) repeat protein